MKKILVVLFLFIFAATCYAEDLQGWDKTKWGMTKEELTSLLKERIRSTEDNKIVLNQVSIGGIPFESRLILEENKLVKVVLAPPTTKDSVKRYNELKSLLVQKYGAPSNEAQSASPYFDKTALWVMGSTKIEMRVFSDLSFIFYTPAENLGGL